MTKKPRKSSNRTVIKGDVHIKDGDLVAGDKSLYHGEGDHTLSPESAPKRKRTARTKSREIDRSLDVSGGDVVFGDKIIKFFQDSLNIYIFKDIKQLVVFLAFFLLVSGAAGGVYWYSNQPKKMTGNYNIAIARFGEIQSDGSIQSSAKAEQISRTLFDYLDAEYQAAGLGLDVDVSHENMPLITQNSQAQELAEKVNADIVIFGNVSVQNEEAKLSPRFFVAEHADTQELTGQDELAHPIIFSLSEAAATGAVNSQLRSRTEILFNFTRSLIHLSQKDMESAERAIRTAISAAEKLDRPFAGQEVLYLIAAKVYLAQDDYSNASQMFDRSLGLNTNYARAHLGRGYMYYAQATASGQYDPALMEKAKAEFELAFHSPEQPEAAYIPAKSHTALGSALTIMAQANGNDPEMFAEAIEHFKYVVDAYQRRQDPNLRGFAAVAYFGIGVVYERQDKKTEAIDAYSQAYELTDDQGLKDRIANQIESLRKP